MIFFLFERYGCVDSISGLYAVKRCLHQEGTAGECEKLGNLSSSLVFTDRSSYEALREKIELLGEFEGFVEVCPCQCHQSQISLTPVLFSDAV